jgi:glycosyltransferase involved in cell wall biosynthesis
MRQQLSRNARYYARDFDWAQIAQRITGVYGEVVMPELAAA